MIAISDIFIRQCLKRWKYHCQFRIHISIFFMIITKPTLLTTKLSKKWTISSLYRLYPRHHSLPVENFIFNNPYSVRYTKRSCYGTKKTHQNLIEYHFSPYTSLFDNLYQRSKESGIDTNSPLLLQDIKDGSSSKKAIRQGCLHRIQTR